MRICWHMSVSQHCVSGRHTVIVVEPLPHSSRNTRRRRRRRTPWPRCEAGERGLRPPGLSHAPLPADYKRYTPTTFTTAAANDSPGVFAYYSRDQDIRDKSQQITSAIWSLGVYRVCFVEVIAACFLINEERRNLIWLRKFRLPVSPSITVLSSHEFWDDGAL